MKKILLALSLWLITAHSIQAQGLMSHIWGQTYLEIQLPNHFDISFENSESYVGYTTDSKFTLMIKKMDYSHLDQSEMLDLVSEMATSSLDLQIIDQGHYDMENMSGAFVEGVDGSGFNTWVCMAICYDERTLYSYIMSATPDSGLDVMEIVKSLYQGN